MTDTPLPAAVGRAPGKLILLGEHAVVYGHPAIAGAVGLHTVVRLWRREGPTALSGAAVEDDRLARAIAAVLPPSGLGVGIESAIPTGRGMGSSAALSLALVRAAAALAGAAPSAAVLFERSLALERIFHGQPSGIDSAVVLSGGLLRFRRGPPPVADPLRPIAPLSFVVLDSGVPGNTAAMVASVRARRPAVDPLLEAIGALVERAQDALGDLPSLGEALDENHALLRQLGVSTAALDDLCALARRNGAFGAKLSGSGGGGVVLALTPPGGEAGLLQAAAAIGVPALCTALGRD